MCYYNVSRHVAYNLNVRSDADEALLDSQDQYLHKPKIFKSLLSSILQILTNGMTLLVCLRMMRVMVYPNFILIFKKYHLIISEEDMELG